ncbi:MAG: ArsR/SmtB family transcription factor [Acidobacteriaceae bacterium]
MADRAPQIFWDWGTAYDLFASLHVLHHPENFGLRPSWAAGVRSRLSGDQRNILEDAQNLFFSSPLDWVSSLPEPKDANSVLASLAEIPPARRLPTMAQHADVESELLKVLKSVLERRAWDEDDLQKLQQHHHGEKARVDKEALVRTLNWWSHPEEFGERYLAALQDYVTVFFAEEEQRIKPFLQQSLARAQSLAASLTFSELFITLSQGVKIPTIEGAEQVTFVPSYWTTPLVMFDCVRKGHWVVLFGARSPQASLVPGDLVPDALLRSLKALSDPTRLLILRYLSDQPLTPSQLARKLRLRPPTVIHHLNALRLAGLVYVTLEEREEKRYTVRVPAVAETFEVLSQFMNNERGV